VLGTIDTGDDGNLKVSQDGASTVAIDPPYAALPYPASGRRVPALWLSERKRSWGWTADGPVVPTLVLEWQPPIIGAKQNSFVELMLGGDGKLEVGELSFAGKSVERPPTGGAASASNAPASPLLAAADGEKPLLARQPEFPPPRFGAGGLHQEEQAPAIRQLVGLRGRLRCAQVQVGKEALGHEDSPGAIDDFGGTRENVSPVPPISSVRTPKRTPSLMERNGTPWNALDHASQLLPYVTSLTRPAADLPGRCPSFKR
jgi:hypothetical protein